ncbi:MAG: hypothetical protein ACREMQ_03775 [Longimicrobiales bacterium]
MLQPQLVLLLHLTQHEQVLMIDEFDAHGINFAPCAAERAD